MTMVEGLWLPLVTPFRDGALDEASLRRMMRHYLAQPIDGFILAADRRGPDDRRRRNRTTRFDRRSEHEGKQYQCPVEP